MKSQRHKWDDLHQKRQHKDSINSDRWVEVYLVGKRSPQPGSRNCWLLKRVPLRDQLPRLISGWKLEGSISNLPARQDKQPRFCNCLAGVYEVPLLPGRRRFG
jgi:hypothetical protein